MTAYTKKKGRSMFIKAKEFMVPAVVYIDPQTPLSKVLGNMKEHDMSEVPVIERGKVIGIVSYDILIKRKRMPLTTKVRDIIVHPPKITGDVDIVDVAKSMVHSGFRCVPVLDAKGKLKGLIRRKDLVNAALNTGLLEGIKAKDIMSEMPRFVFENHTIHKAIEVMRHLSIQAIPVVNKDEKVVGVVGVKDIAPYLFVPRHRERFGELAGEKRSVKIKVASVMRSPAVTVSPEADLEKCVKLMNENDISTIVVVDGTNKPLGIVTMIDIIEGIASIMPEETVPINITGLELADPMVASSVYDIAHGSIKKIEKMFRVHLLSMHISEHHASRKHKKEGVYEVRARLYTDRRMYYAVREGYEPLALINEVFDTLEYQVKKDHERLTSGKGGIKRWK